MKTKALITIVVVLAIFAKNNSFAQCGDMNHDKNTSNVQTNNNKADLTGTHSFKVFGNCDMCKARIEKASLSVNGVKSASWNTETKILQVDLKEGIDINKVHAAIALAGHDTDKNKATDENFNKLPGCCKYR